ncbi:hypothetical protein V2J09_010770 [Rumex salicifolius]
MKMQSSAELKVDIGSKEEKLDEALSPNAVAYARSLSAHILVTIGINSRTDLDTFKAQLPLALNHPRFSSLIVEDEEENGKLKWVQLPNVNIDDHIIVPSIHPTLINDRVAGDKFVEEYLHNLTKTSLDTRKPPWEFHLLDVNTSEADSIWILRIHHALGDGISITSHVLSWTRQLSDPNSLPTMAATKKKKTKTKTDDFRVWNLPQRFLLAVWWWLEVIWNTIIDVSKFLATIFFLKDSSMLVMSSPETDTKRRRIVYKTISLDDMKFIKNAMNCTINDVAIAIIEAGFCRYINRRFGNENQKDNMKPKSNLQKLRMRIGLAVNLRPLQGIQGLDDIKKKNTKLGLGNQVGIVILMPMSIRLRDDPKEYVCKAKANVDRIKRSLEPKASMSLMKLLAKIFGFKIVGLIFIKIGSHVSIWVSNVPGPVEEISCFGHPPLLIHLQSCTNKMAIVLSVREDVMIDPHELLDDINGSFQLISAAVRK